MKRPVLILGATSSIARGTAQAFAERGYSLCLAARNKDEVERIASDIKIRHQVAVTTVPFDASDTDSHSKFFQDTVRSTKGLSGVVLCFGFLGDADETKQDYNKAKEVFDCNLLHASSILTHCADFFEQRGCGFIAGISSVAGDRGRQSNYVYGAAKGGFNLFLQGLRNRLYHSDVQVTTIKPGFVDTAMTFGHPGMFLVASPKAVGRQIVKAIEKQRNIVYVPWFWTAIMGIIKMIPEALFKRLKL